MVFPTPAKVTRELSQLVLRSVVHELSMKVNIGYAGMSMHNINFWYHCFMDTTKYNACNWVR